jgi:ribosomal protein L3 glutamine methyltransferase
MAVVAAMSIQDSAGIQDLAVFDELLSVRDWIRWGASEFQRAGLFFGHGTDNAWDEAAQLVLWSIATPWERLNQIVDTRLTRVEKHEIHAVFQRRIHERMPAPYLTGTAFFAGLEFAITFDTLIPRSPLAELIENGFQPWLIKEPEFVLDLCTGSGCIGIAIAHAFPEVHVDLSDISEPALAVAQDNILRHAVEDRVTAIHSDLFAQLPGCYDLIVSNPPYVDAEDMASLPTEYQAEPRMALESGVDGLELTRRLLREAAEHLNDEGLLIVEVGNSAVALEAAFPRVPFTWLEFARGGDGVFLLTREQLVAHAADFS